MIPDGAEEVMLIELDSEAEAKRQSRNVYEEDDVGGPSRVQCAAN